MALNNKDPNVYYIFYLENIYTLIKEGLMTYSWEYIGDIDIYRYSCQWDSIEGLYKTYNNPFIKAHCEKKNRIS